MVVLIKSLQLCYFGLESHGAILLWLSWSPLERDRHGGYDMVRPADDPDHSQRHHRLLRGILLRPDSPHKGVAFEYFEKSFVIIILL